MVIRLLDSRWVLTHWASLTFVNQYSRLWKLHHEFITKALSYIRVCTVCKYVFSTSVSSESVFAHSDIPGT